MWKTQALGTEVEGMNKRAIRKAAKCCAKDISIPCVGHPHAFSSISTTACVAPVDFFIQTDSRKNQEPKKLGNFLFCRLLLHALQKLGES